MKEDKWKTLKLLEEALRSTRRFADLISLEYITDIGEEYVVPVYEHGKGEAINVLFDSSFALIKDVIKGIQ